MSLTLFPPILLQSLSLSLHFSQHLSLSFPFSLSNSLSFTHFYLSLLPYGRIRSPFPIHSNHSLFYSQATHKSNTHHEHHSVPVKRFHLCETLPSVWNALSPLRFLILSFILFNTCLYTLANLHVPSLPLKPSCITPYCSGMLHSSSTLRIYLYGTASHGIALHCIAFSHFIQPVSEQSVMAKKGRKQSILKSKEHDAKKEGGRP